MCGDTEHHGREHVLELRGSPQEAKSKVQRGLRQDITSNDIPLLIYILKFLASLKIPPPAGD
jgi:hypothetical protein